VWIFTQEDAMKPKRASIVAWAVCAIVLPFEIYGLVAAKKLDAVSLVTTLGVFGLVFVAFALLRRRGGEKIEKDERTMRLESRALSYSWIVSYLCIAAIMYFDYIELIHPTAGQALTLVVLIMALSSFVARFLVNRKGDLS
jgi:hypothetical protein